MVALGRRWLAVLFSMYFDDACFQDLGEAKGRAQRYVNAIFRLMGIPLQADKRVSLAPVNDFMGLTHEIGDCMRTGQVAFQPKEALKMKAQTMLRERLQEGSCTAAQASKIRGVLGFTLTGLYGKVGRGGQHALLKRQYWDKDNTAISSALEEAMKFYIELMDTDLKRVFYAQPRLRRRMIVASDGRLDESKPASVATLLQIGNTKLALVAEVPQVLTQEWAERAQYIDLVEQSAVVMAILQQPEWFRDTDVVWFIDNSVALAGLVKGANRGLQMDRGCAVIHLALAALKANLWWEYVESDSNWSDGASREGLMDRWIHDNEFEVNQCEIPAWPWQAEAHERAIKVQECCRRKDNVGD